MADQLLAFLESPRAFWLILGIAALLRLLFLAIKPPHFDEGINGWFVDQMVKNGFYRYDPTNYHGPLHFYILFLSQTLFGRNLWALRLPVVMASIGSVWLALQYEQILPRKVARLAALAMAVSPGFVFYGRYSIHEVWLLLFSMMFIFGLLGLWRRGSISCLWYAGMGLAGMILTKETYIIHVGCALIAFPLTALSVWLSRLSAEISETPDNRPEPLPGWFPRLPQVDDARAAKQVWTWLDLILVVAVGAAAIVFFYSGTFLNWSGVKGLFQTFHAWFKTGSNGNGHEKPFYYWLMLISRYEWPVLIGLIVCGCSQLFRSVFLRYLAINAVGVFLAYSIVHYKTPWCVISIVWPLLFLFGGTVLLPPIALPRILLGALMASLLMVAFYCRSHFDYREIWPFIVAVAVPLVLLALVDRIATNALIGLALAFSFGYAIWLNYFRCTTETEPYVYVQTYNDIYKLTRPVLALAQSDPALYQMVGHIIRPSPYPLPWILDDFPRVGYYEHDNLPTTLDADFLLVQEDKIKDVDSKLHERYYTEPLTVRPYQEPSKLYLRASLFHRFFPGRGPELTPAPR